LAILVFALPGSFIYAVKFTVITRVLVYASTCVALPILRRRAKTAAAPDREDAPPPFVVPGGTAVAVVCVLLCLWLLANSGWVEIRDVSIATAIGMIVYAITRLGHRKAGSSRYN
jgi:amino acid transporter